MTKKLLLLILISIAAGLLGSRLGFTVKQTVILSIFTMSIIGTLFFWDFRLSFVFLGSGLLLSLGTVSIQKFIEFASLDVILFLISMMIIVGMMKDAGLFEFLVTVFLRVKHLNGAIMFAILMFTSAAFSGLMGEVASIVVMTAVILNISDFLEVDPLPLVISSVMATNIGSASTLLGNPVGILIAARGRLSFEDFLLHAMPLSAVVMIATFGVLFYFNRKYIRALSEKIEPYGHDKGFLYLISIPPDRRTKISMGIFGVTIFLMTLHKRFEHLLDLELNTFLFVLPVVSAGLVMLYRHDRARHYIENEIEWPSLLFFIFLFAQAGVIQASGIAALIAQKIIGTVGQTPEVLSGIVLFTSGFLSSSLDNVVTVASYTPIVNSLQAFHVNLKPLWWALLFGACYGGNITMIGSTANIIALGLLEKERGIRVRFLQWFKIGFTVGLLSMAIAYMAMLFLPGLF